MTLPTEKRCPRCEATKPAEAFGQTTQANGKAYLRAHCRACQAARKRERLATPEGRAKKAEQNRRYYATPEGREAFRRYSATPKGRARDQRCRARLRARFTAAFDHFEGRRGWERIVAGVLTRHPQAHGLQLYSDRFEHMSAWYVGDEPEPWVSSTNPKPTLEQLDKRLITQLRWPLQGPQPGEYCRLGRAPELVPCTIPEGTLLRVE